MDDWNPRFGSKILSPLLRRRGWRRGFNRDVVVRGIPRRGRRRGLRQVLPRPHHIGDPVGDRFGGVHVRVLRQVLPQLLLRLARQPGQQLDVLLDRFFVLAEVDLRVLNIIFQLANALRYNAPRRCYGGPDVVNQVPPRR